MGWELASGGRAQAAQITALLLAIASLLPSPARAAATAPPDLAETRKLLLKGRYEEVATLASAAVKDPESGENWHALHLEALLSLGRYAEAASALSNAVAHEPRSIRILWFGQQACASIGQTTRARDLLNDLAQLVARRPWAYDDPADLVVFGRAALLLGAEPKSVLDRAFEVAKKANPDLRDPYLAIGDLALDKHDYALAAQAYSDGLRRLPDDPDLHAGLGRAYAGSERTEAVGCLKKALELNPHHVPSLLQLADHALDAEDYDGANRLLDRVREVNPNHPEAWAYRSAIAHLRNETAIEQTARAQALRLWTNNPHVDHLIGRKLSQNYRFREGAAHQRTALEFAPDFLPARAQLASDLLRLGLEDEGWRLAHEVHQRDGYDVAAFNLVTLHDTMTRFVTLSNTDFVLRMSPHEANVYGAQALDLLTQARRTIAPRYGTDPHRPTVVEIFPESKDFGVRTFGMPENPGYLGVCFGPVITANSPAAHPGRPVNWQAVLWHEFCHVVTLDLTRNRMPRWLSEGISVYEERRANPAWGERMIPRYREMILEGELKPVATLSAAFLDPESSLHLQFAYFESSLVVEFIVERFGLDALKAILLDLRNGAFINDTLARHCAPIQSLEKDFAAFARAQAERLAPGLDWQQPDLDILQPGAESRLAEWTRTHPNNYWALRSRAQQLVRDRAWPQARETLDHLITLYPDEIGADSAYALLARVHCELGNPNAERQALDHFARRNAEATDAYLRLMELDANTANWDGVHRAAQRYLAVNPLLPQPHRYLALAAEKTGDLAAAIRSQQTLLELDPSNPADVHFQLARLLHQTGNPDARRHLLQTLEDAPRHRAALDLLRRIGPSTPDTNQPAPAPAPASQPTPAAGTSAPPTPPAPSTPHP